MNKENNKMLQQDSELSIWELTNLMKKNWLLITCVLVIFLIGGLFYSFVVQEQNVSVYTSSKEVMFSEWEYYPAQIYNTYAWDLKNYINSELDKNIITKSSLTQTKNNNDKIDYVIKIEYAPNITKSEAEEAALYAVEWHNNMLDSQAETVQNNMNESLDSLRLDYEELRAEYFSFISNSDMTLVENMVEADMIQSESDIYLEIWQNEKEKLHAIKNDLVNIENYYLESIPVKTAVQSTWQLNIVFSIAAGCIIAFILVFLRKSYHSYKNIQS